jgi:hypothetical protein
MPRNHRELHRCGDEKRWWEKVGINPTLAARTLWPHTHPLPMREMADPTADLGEQDQKLPRSNDGNLRRAF